MNKRQIIKTVLDGQKPPYVPWSFGFTLEAKDKLIKHYRTDDLQQTLDNHLLKLGGEIGFFEQIDENTYKDVFGVVWDRTVDKDIGIVVRSETPFDDLLNIIKMERPLRVSPDEFIGVDIRNALYSLMRWYFKSRNAVCLSTGINIRKNMGKRYALEWDHIFPYSVLKENGYDLNNRFKYSLAHEITNRVILTQTANRTKSTALLRII